MRDSVFMSCIRTFFITLFAVIGISAGLCLFVLMIAAFSSSTTEPERIYSQEVVANAEGQRKILSKDSPVVLKLNIVGVVGSEDLNMSRVRRQLVESREGDLKNNRVKAVLVYINSPGGTVIDADGIYHAIKTYKEQYKVPVYAYVDGICASGGFYIACAADHVITSDSSLLGSIGVVSPPFFNFSQLIEKYGVQALTLIAGKGKDDLNPFRPWRKDEAVDIQGLLDFYYQKFIEIVTTSRPQVNKTKLVDEYGAKVFNPVDAHEIGLVNSIDNYRSALKQLLKQISVEDDYYQVVELNRTTWYSELFSTKNPLFTGKVTHHIQLTPNLDPNLMNQFLYLYTPDGI